MSMPFSCLFYLWPEGQTALLLSIPSAIFGSTYIGPTMAMTQGLVKLRMRATASATLLFILNLIGLGLRATGRRYTQRPVGPHLWNSVDSLRLNCSGDRQDVIIDALFPGGTDTA